jgi:molybdopterin-guanine dinucleotide biosynthesis protein A
MYDFKLRYVDPMVQEQKAAGARGAYAFTNDAIAVLFLLKAHTNLSYRLNRFFQHDSYSTFFHKNFLC